MDDFKKIYELHGSYVYKYLRCLTGDEQLSEELTQETFYRALKSIHKFRGQCKLSVWLCQIAKYTYFSYRRKNGYELVNIDDISICAADSETPERLIEREEGKETLLKAVGALPEPYREVVRLRAFGDMSFKEISEATGGTETWARTTFYRGKLKLKELLNTIEGGDKNENKL